VSAAGVRYLWDDRTSTFRAPSVPDLSASPEAARRLALVRGVDMPNTSSTGPLPGTTFTNVESTAGIIDINSAWLSANGISLDADGYFTITGKRFWGKVRPKSPRIRFRSCMFHGHSADLSDNNGLVQCFNDGTVSYHWVAEHCLFDPNYWVTDRGLTQMAVGGARPYINYKGIHGGDFELRWCEIRNVEDGVNWVQSQDISDGGNSGWGEGIVAPAGQRFSVLDRCLIHKCGYVNTTAYTAQSGGYPHCDAFQFNSGRNLWITGCMLGGQRNTARYDTYPLTTVDYSSEDFGTSALIIQQEGTTTPGTASYITNVLIEDSWAGGAGGATINTNVKGGNDLAGVTIRRLKLADRASNWGVFYSNGARVDFGAGAYTTKNGTSPALTFQNVTRYPSGTAVAYQ
jgi:hypothetical protein